MFTWLLRPFFSIIVLAGVISGVFAPVFRLILSGKKITPPFASLFTCFLIFILVFVPVVFLVGVLSKEAYALYLMGKSAVISDQMKVLLESSRVLEKANSFLANFQYEITGEEFNRTLSEIGKFVGFFLYEQARSVASNMLSFVINFFLMLLVIFYLLTDGDKLLTFIIELSPLPREQDEKLIGKFKEMAGAILIGNGLGGMIQGILGGLVFWIFQLNSPILWGVIMTLLAFLPIVGIGIVLIPASIFLILKGRIAAGIFFFVFYVTLSGGIEYLFKPKVVGNRVKMHTLLVFLSIISGLKLFGIIGIIYGPIVITAFLTLTDIYQSSYRVLVEPVEGKNHGT